MCKLFKMMRLTNVLKNQQRGTKPITYSSHKSQYTLSLSWLNQISRPSLSRSTTKNHYFHHSEGQNSKYHSTVVMGRYLEETTPHSKTNLDSINTNFNNSTTTTTTNIATATTTIATPTTTTTTATSTTTFTKENDTSNNLEYQKSNTKPWQNGPGLKEFINSSANMKEEEEDILGSIPRGTLEEHYLLDQKHDHHSKRSFYVETYGCQMNVSDTEIVQSILKKAGFEISHNAEDASIVFLNTCSIRDNAEQKVWKRLEYFHSLRKKRVKNEGDLVVGVLGCMAERLKTKLLETEPRLVDIVAGPDAYRDLPHLVSSVIDYDYSQLDNHQQEPTAVNVMLSLDETYADITPVRTSPNKVSAFVTIMRGCNNMCSYCIVPFTRGKERSRPVGSIEDEVRQLSKEGYKEITLLGQNVNSYWDKESPSITGAGFKKDHSDSDTSSWLPDMSEGFKTIYKLKKGAGVRFAELVDRVSQIDPEMRVRFTSPHPKDFPDDLLAIIRDKPNVCKNIHIPAQSGNSNVLERMRRGYTREVYLDLIKKMKQMIPDVTLSSDFISGFCGETEEEHLDTVTLMDDVKYDNAFMFAYSLREKTFAHRTMKDDVPAEVKKRRLAEVISTFRKHLVSKLTNELGRVHLVLIDGPSRKSSADLVGRTDTNRKVVMHNTAHRTELSPGTYVEVKIEGFTGQTLIGDVLKTTTLSEFFNQHGTFFFHSQ